MPKGKRNPKDSQTRKAKGSDGQTALMSRATVDLRGCEGIQCEMGSETYRKYWKIMSRGNEESESISVQSNAYSTDVDPLACAEEESVNAPSIGDLSVLSADENYSPSSSMQTNSVLPLDVQVKIEPNDHVVTSNTAGENKPSGTLETMSQEAPIKIEEGEVAVSSASSDTSSNLITVNPEGKLIVTVPPSLQWPNSLNSLIDVIKQKVVFSVNGNVLQAVIKTPDGELDDPSKRETQEVGTASNDLISENSDGNEQCALTSPSTANFECVIKTELFTCGDCMGVFTSSCEYEEHCATHNTSEPFKCLYCHQRFNGRLELSTHMNAHSEKPFSCQHCHECFLKYEAFLAHCRTHESDTVEESETPKCQVVGQIFCCSQCEKTFRDADSLKHHEFTHSEGELFPCDQCGLTFREESQLGSHLKLHLKKQRCDVCCEDFTNVFDFNEHYITHKHASKVYECVECKITYNNIISLRKHATTHGLKVRWCGDCGGSGHIEFSEYQYPEGVPCLDEVLCNFDDVTGTKKRKRREESGYSCEDDPLRLDHDLQGSLLSSDLEEVQVEVKLDDVLLQNEDNEGCHFLEKRDTTEVVTKEGTKRQRTGKRKNPGETKEKLPKSGSKKPANTRPKRPKPQPKTDASPSLKRTKSSKKTEEEPQLEVRLELRERSKRSKSTGSEQETVLLAT